MTDFKSLNLHEQLQAGLDKMGFETPTEIQQKMIPDALTGVDIMASAETGSGKTAAFLLPTFHKLLENPDESKAKRKKRGPRVLVLTPTRELAEQVMKVSQDIRAFTDLSVKSVVGGVPIMKHKRALREVVDVLVATPGRLMDLMRQGDVHLQDVDTFILDEADRMLDMGFSEDVLQISNAATKPERQNILVSATLEDKKIEKVVKQVLIDPVRIELTHAKKKHENITQAIYRASDYVHKLKIVQELAKDSNIWQAVIFVATKAMTEQLAQELASKGEKVDVLHGDMRQSARKVSIKRMQAGQIRFLIATDVAARGLDIKELTHVINFDLPRQKEDYIHRIGRVGRGGKTGEAISLVATSQWPLMKDIQHMLDTTLDERVIEGLEWRPSKKGEKKRAQAKRQDKKQRSGNRKPSGGEGKKFGSSSRRNEVRAEVEPLASKKKSSFKGKGKFEGKSENRSKGKFESRSSRSEEGNASRPFKKKGVSFRSRSGGGARTDGTGGNSGLKRKSFGGKSGEGRARSFGNTPPKPTGRTKKSRRA